jgi:tetratricopeptide (TPR) repeat protein
MGRYAIAEPLHLRSLAIREEKLGANHPDTATSLNNLAVLYQSMGRHPEAESLYLRVIEILVDQFGENYPNTEAGWRNFITFLRQLITEKQTHLLSNHPITQYLLSQL